mgnify:FL=1
MQQVKSGDVVNVHYHGRLTSGETFDSSEGRAPLQFVVGSGQVIKGFDDAVLSMKVGDKLTVTIPVDLAYGPKNDQMLLEYPLNEFPSDIQAEEGMELHMNDADGNVFPVRIAKVLEESVILDANHTLAGEDLIFDLELISILNTMPV